jgi:hypothetical protein
MFTLVAAMSVITFASDVMAQVIVTPTNHKAGQQQIPDQVEQQLL